MYRNNIRAIRIVKELQKDKRQATETERAELALYAGWGGLKGVFNPDNVQWRNQYRELKDLLDPAEYAAARRSQLDAHYTPGKVIRPMYRAIERLGFRKGRILEPSLGTGAFFGMMPLPMRENSYLHGCELDLMTSRIAGYLYPSARIAKGMGFQNYSIPAGYFDLAIGNPPFGGQSLSDEKGTAYSGWSIHNYFFAKSIDLLRPGGLMPMVVSHSFLDKLDPHVRHWIARRAELVAGVRLPNTAFEDNAHTEVVTDVLIFRRLDEKNLLGKFEEPDWLNTTEVQYENVDTGGMAYATVNDYFIKNPHHVLGKPVLANTMYRADTYTVEPSGDLEAQLNEWVESLPQNIYVEIDRSSVATEHEMEVPEQVKEGCFFIQDDVVFYRLADQLGKTRAVAWEAPNARALERMKAMIGLREALRFQMRSERSYMPGEAIEGYRAELSKRYDDFFKDYGFLNDPVNRRIFIDDTEAALLQSLEFDYEKSITASKAEELGIEPRPARAKKADIFSKRVLYPPVENIKVETAKDALLHCLNVRGRVDMAYIQGSYQRDEQTIIDELGDVLYRDPVKGLVTADEYLSGDVKTKLLEAKKAAGADPQYHKNVEALKHVVPADKLPSEIYVSLGGPWVPSDMYSLFAKDISGADAIFNHSKVGGQWLMSRQSTGDVVKNTNEYGTPKMGAIDILYALMNSRALEVKKAIEVEGHVQYVTDEVATEAVRQQGDKIKNHWENWIWADSKRTDLLTTLYNDKYNRSVTRKYNGGHLSFPGMSLAITLDDHQKNGVWRGLQDRVVLYDQVVGAGKTFELVALAMEFRRLGISNKPMIGVPNHLTLQWRSEFYRLYPGCNVLAATPEDFDKDNRERFFSKVVTGNWDAIIVGHSSLKKLGIPRDTEEKIYKEQFDEIADSIEAMKRDRGDRNIIRDMEKIKQTLETKLKNRKELGGKKDNVVNFEDLGVDAMFIDELHEFKNLFFTTQMQRVAGLGNPLGSGKAFDLFIKVLWLQDTFGENAPWIGATGTPVSNSLAEMYTMQRLMKYRTMQREGLHMFDSWAKLYGDVQTVYEVAPSGTGYRLSQRFAKFKNLSSLMADYHSFADVVTLDDLKAHAAAKGKRFPVPKIKTGKPINVVVERSPLQTKFFGVPEIKKDKDGNPIFRLNMSKLFSLEANESGKWLLQGENIHKTFDSKEKAEEFVVTEAITPLMEVDPKSIVGQFENLRELTRRTKGRINALSLTGLANKAGLDYRLIDPHAPDFSGSKINAAIQRMLSTYHEWDTRRGTQLVFCDLSVPLSAKAKMASKEKRIYVRNDDGNLTHKKGTLHTIKTFEGFPYYLVAAGKGKTRTYTMYDCVSGVVIKDNLESKQDGHEFVEQFLKREGGQERWLDLREDRPAIEVDEIEEYKNGHGINEEADSADHEVTLEDIEGATGVTAFSIYDDIKAKLIRAGVPSNQIEFIHDHDTPQAKALLFKRMNNGDIRLLLGSTPKLGAGTNVQERLVAEHHIDAPYRPSDLEQREGRIIRRGNLFYEEDPDNFEVGIYRYATSQTYDTRRWQLLEHKAAGIEQMRKYSGESEIEDVASEAANSAEMKAAASGNPLILKETQLSNEVKKLRALSKAHVDSQYMLNNRYRNQEEYAFSTGPRRIKRYGEIIEARDSAEFLCEHRGRKIHSKEELLDLTKHLSEVMKEEDAKEAIVYRGCEFEFVRNNHFKEIKLVYPDLSDTRMDVVSPTGVVTRMDNWLQHLEEQVSQIKGSMEHSKGEMAKVKGLLGLPFAGAGDLNRVIAEHARVQRALMKANSTAAVKPEERAAFEQAVGKQKDMLKRMGLGEALQLFEADEVEVEEELVTAGIFEGEVHGINDKHLRQHVGRGKMVKHNVNLLSKVPEIGERICIQYRNGMGFVDHSQSLEMKEPQR